MLIVVTALFIIAALFGLIVLTAILRNEKTPKFMVFAHGSFATIALLMMFAYMATGHNATLLLASIILLVLAALGGFTLLTFDMRNKPIPKMLALLHPFIAIIGLIMLITYIVLAVST